jgi:putative exosortase-associated protein (TIGR04073 family)
MIALTACMTHKSRRNLVKKLFSVAMMMVFAAGVAAPAFADAAAVANSDQYKNVKSGSRNVSTGWVEVLDNTHAEAAKGKSAGEQITGVVAGGAIGVRRTIHRIGAGAIDLITFWIPKKQPLINPEKARLE